MKCYKVDNVLSITRAIVWRYLIYPFAGPRVIGSNSIHFAVMAHSQECKLIRLSFVVA